MAVSSRNEFISCTDARRDYQTLRRLIYTLQRAVLGINSTATVISFYRAAWNATRS